MDPARLVGAWELEELSITRPDGEVVYPLGVDARGLLIYSGDGWVSAALSRAERGHFAADRLETAARVSDGEKLAAFDSYVSYAGRYTIDGDEVVHEIITSMVPTVVGQSLRRRFTFEGVDLVLSYEVEGSRGTNRYRLRWRRP